MEIKLLGILHGGHGLSLVPHGLRPAECDETVPESVVHRTSGPGAAEEGFHADFGESAPAIESVFRRSLNMIHNQSVQRRLRRLQVQPELLMQSFLQRRYLKVIR
jgi:hypothetical protein